MNTTQRVTRWLLFSVLIALSPLIATYLILWTKGIHPNYSDIVGTGELYLVSIALCGAGIGDLLTSTRASPDAKLMSGGCTLFVLILSGWLYASGADARLHDDATDPAAISLISSVLFFMGLGSCGCCVALAEG